MTISNKWLLNLVVNLVELHDQPSCEVAIDGFSTVSMSHSPVSCDVPVPPTVVNDTKSIRDADDDDCAPHVVIDK